MRQFMADRQITAGAVAVARDGHVLMSAGYGNLDADGLKPVQADTPFRIASLSKPITAAAIHKLAADGKVVLDAPVLTLLKIEPPAGVALDPRWRRITVKHLLEHQGGWDRGQQPDPMFRSREIAESLGKPPPASADDVVRYMLGQPLQFDPGTKTVYSNFG